MLLYCCHLQIPQNEIGRYFAISDISGSIGLLGYCNIPVIRMLYLTGNLSVPRSLMGRPNYLVSHTPLSLPLLLPHSIHFHHYMRNAVSIKPENILR
jgi:hypothetical protein